MIWRNHAQLVPSALPTESPPLPTSHAERRASVYQSRIEFIRTSTANHSMRWQSSSAQMSFGEIISARVAAPRD